MGAVHPSSASPDWGKIPRSRISVSLKVEDRIVGSIGTLCHERHCTYVWSRLAPDREGDLRTALLVGAANDPFDGDSMEIERALTYLGVMSAGPTPS